MQLSADFHVHSNYSDGRPLPLMLAAASGAGLEAIGFTDHCNVSDRERLERAKLEFGFNLDRTLDRRTRALESLRERADLTIYDGVELDYHPADEDAIAAFLDEADFDYVIGSVHEIDGANVFDRAHFADKSDDERAAIVETYYDRQVSLIESGLFDVVGHLDVVERTPELRGFTTPDHHERVADALARSRTRPEVNAGAIDGYGEFHPAPDFLATIRERGVPFVPGTDSHRPEGLRETVPALGDRFADLGLDPATPFG